jgi:hypothetical protein
MKTVIANIKHAIRGKEQITIGGGVFSAHEFQFIVDQYETDKQKEEQRHNGWTNYATWRVNLEMFDSMEPTDFGDGHDLPHELADSLKYYADEILCQGCGYEGLVLDYARAFLSDVNWHEIAKHMITDYAEA